MRLFWNLSSSQKLGVILLPIFLLCNVGAYIHRADQQVVLDDLKMMAPQLRHIKAVGLQAEMQNIPLPEIEKRLKTLFQEHHLKVISYNLQGTSLPLVEVHFTADLDTDVYGILRDLEDQKLMPCRIVSLGLFKKPSNQGLQGQLKLQVMSWS